MSIKIRHSLIILLIILGLLQSLGYLFQLPQLRGLAMATVASPLPLVFSHFRGLETFSSEFTAHVTVDENGQDRLISMKLTPEVYARLKGPYNRRNVYGAIVSYGIKMTEPHEIELVQDVLQFGFCGAAPVLKSFGMTEPIKKVEIDVTNKVNQIDGKLSVECRL